MQKGRQSRLFGGSRKQRLEEDDEEGFGDSNAPGPGEQENWSAPPPPLSDYSQAEAALPPQAKAAGRSRLSMGKMMPSMPGSMRRSSNSGAGPARMDSFPASGSLGAGGPIPTLGGGPMPAVTSAVPATYGGYPPANDDGAARERERQEQEELELAMAMSLSVADEERRSSQDRGPQAPQPAQVQAARAPVDASQEDEDLRRALALSAQEAAAVSTPMPNLVDFSASVAQPAAPVANDPFASFNSPAVAVDPFAAATAPRPSQSAFDALVGSPPPRAQPAMAPSPFGIDNPFVPPAQPPTAPADGFDAYSMNYDNRPPAYVQPAMPATAATPVVGQPVVNSAVAGWAAQPPMAMAQQTPMGQQTPMAMAQQTPMGQQMPMGGAYATGARAPRVPGASPSALQATPPAPAADPFASLI